MAKEEYLRGFGNEFESEALPGAWFTTSFRFFFTFFFCLSLSERNPPPQKKVV